jgi:hypothetical protein
LRLAGLWLINTRTVIRGREIAARERGVRYWYGGMMLALSLALVAAQWVVFIA